MAAPEEGEFDCYIFLTSACDFFALGLIAWMQGDRRHFETVCSDCDINVSHLY